MTWSAVVTDVEGNKGKGNWHVCTECQHNATCYIPKVSNSVGSLLTSVDTGSDGYMASGSAILKCNGFKRK
jgi:hypothetical protein